MTSLTGTTRTPHRALVLRHSHSGQTARCVESLRDKLEAYGWEVRVRGLEPLGARPFPWTKRAFLEELPECVLKAPEALVPVAWETGDDSAELVVLASPVWYLSPSRPMSSFLQGPESRLLRGKRVAILFTCRNMWQNAALWTVERVRAIGAAHVSFHAVLDRSPGLLSFVTTPLWLLSGKRKWAFLPAVGMREGARAGGLEAVVDEIARTVAHDGGTPAHPDATLFTPSIDAKSLRTWFLPEVVGMALWTALARSVRVVGGAPGTRPLARKAALAACAVVMVVAILALVPALRLTGRPLLRLIAVGSARTHARLGALEVLARARGGA